MPSSTLIEPLFRVQCALTQIREVSIARRAKVSKAPCLFVIALIWSRLWRMKTTSERRNHSSRSGGLPVSRAHMNRLRYEGEPQLCELTFIIYIEHDTFWRVVKNYDDGSFQLLHKLTIDGGHIVFPNFSKCKHVLRRP